MKPCTYATTAQEVMRRTYIGQYMYIDSDIIYFAIGDDEHAL